jgi:hypothetical protein
MSMPDMSKPKETNKSSKPGKQLRDPKGQVIGLMSLAYVFVTIVFCAWVMNSGQALTYKTKMMNTAVQTAATGAIFYYWGQNGYGWSFAAIQPYIQNAATSGFMPNTFYSFYPSFSTTYLSGSNVMVGLNGTLVGFQGWNLPGALTATEGYQVPPVLP